MSTNGVGEILGEDWERKRSCEGLGKSARGSVTRTRERRKMKVLRHQGTSILYE